MPVFDKGGPELCAGGRETMVPFLLEAAKIARRGEVRASGEETAWPVL